jgi:hypothetical protein
MGSLFALSRAGMAACAAEIPVLATFGWFLFVMLERDGAVVVTG